MQLVLQLTRDCNLACTYCYQRHVKGPGMTPAVARRALEWLIDAGHSQIALTYFGGEPLLNRELIESTWPQLRQIGVARGVLVSAKISTNGTRLDRSFAHFALETALFVSLSVDGAPAVQNEGRPFAGGCASSGAVERALAHLVAERTPFATYQVVTPKNCGDLDAPAAWLFERGSRLLASSLAVDQVWSQADFDRLQRSYADLARRYVHWLERGERFYLAPFDSKIDARTRHAAYREESCCAGLARP